MPGDSARSMNQATVPDWTDNSFNRKVMIVSHDDYLSAEVKIELLPDELCYVMKKSVNI